MKKIFLFILFGLFSSGLIYGQSHQPQSSTLEKSLLWEISGNGLKASSYLFGTNHLVGKNFADSLPGIGRKFNICKTVVGEVFVDSSFFQKAGKAMYLTNNTLDEIFSPQEYQIVKTSVKSLAHMELKSLNTLKPAALEIFLLSFLSSKTISTKNPELDIYFQEEGKKHGDKVVGLETVEFQLGLFFNVSIEDQKKHLLFAIHEMDAARKNINAINILYQQQDLEGINKFMLITDKEYTEKEKDAMLKNRNLQWMTELPAIMNDQPAFIAVGAAHLAGEYGLINQLRLKGYTVNAVSPLAP